MREKISLNQKWAFSKEADACPKEMPKNWYTVHLPHTWNAIDGQDGGNDYYRGICYYAKEIRKCDLTEQEKYYLEICGANSSADVYWNGEKLAHHDGGYARWRVDLSGRIREDNLLVIAVDNRENPKVYPQMADFTFYGGLYRDVNILAMPKSHFDVEYYGSDGVFVTPKVQGKDATVQVQVRLTDADEWQKLVYTIRDREGRTVAEEIRPVSESRICIPIENVRLWQGRKDPYLYELTVSLMDGEKELDTVRVTFGCRDYEIDPERGFILNGKPYPLRGVSRHQDRWGVGNALTKEDHREDMDLICEMGANTIRLAHYQHDAYFYDLCDEKGMVVWAEIPYISKHQTQARENTISQMKELILQNYNHPGIVVWGLSNEITMSGGSDEELLENHRILNDLCHELDPDRKTVIAVVSMCDMHDPYIQIPDVVSYNHYFGWYGGDTSMYGPWLDEFHRTFPKVPIGLSEYGCEALDWHSAEPQQGDYTEEYQARYHEDLIRQLFVRPYLWATHVWNMFDFGADSRNEGGENGQNHKGLVTFDRKYKKDAFYAYKAWLSDEPFVHICGKRYKKRPEAVTRVMIYSNQDTVELFANGKSQGKQTRSEHFFPFEIKHDGVTELVAVAGNCRDTAVIEKVEEFPDEYRLKEQGAVLNWFDITESKDGYSLNDKVSDIMQNPTGREWIMDLLESLNGEETMFSLKENEGMMQMMGGFTILRLINLLGAGGLHVSGEALLSLNKKLNKLKK